MKTNTAIVIPNWNGIESIGACLDSLLHQSYEGELVVVDNGSEDGSQDFIKNKYPNVTVLAQPKNLGFAGGVNVGLRYAIENNFEYVALFNNDAVAEKNWLERLVKRLNASPEAGIATCKLMSSDKKHIDSTGDLYTTWGLPYPRGRDEIDTGKYDGDTDVFGASGGASLYRVKMLEQIGLFDEDFFAYFEDIDISFRAQLAGWKIKYVPKSVTYHQIGATSGKIKGFTTYQTLKNLPWVYWKNVPFGIAVSMFPKIFLSYWSIFFSSITKGRIMPALKGAAVCHLLIFKKLFIERRRILKNKTVSNKYISSIIVHNLPPNAHKLRRIRSLFVRSK